MQCQTSLVMFFLRWAESFVLSVESNLVEEFPMSRKNSVSHRGLKNKKYIKCSKMRSIAISNFTHAAKFCRASPRLAFNLRGSHNSYKVLFTVKCHLQGYQKRQEVKKILPSYLTLFFDQLLISLSPYLLIAQNVPISPAAGNSMKQDSRGFGGFHTWLSRFSPTFSTRKFLPS